MSHVVHIDQDALIYRPDGLEVPEDTPVALEVGYHNQIVVRRPVRRRPLALGRGGFPENSCFPTPQTLMEIFALSLHEVFTGWGVEANPQIFQLFGHAHAGGSAAHNKSLSQQRADIVLALLRGDVDAFMAIAKAASPAWGTDVHQTILRVLGCDPGPNDGEIGELTRRAARYVARVDAGD